MAKVTRISLILLGFLLLFNSAAGGDGVFNVTLLKTKGASNPSAIIVKITNSTDQEYKVLKWNTPLEKRLRANIFRIYAYGKKKPYRGILVKRTQPSEKDYIVFKPHESKKAVIDLSQYYKLDVDADYEISFKGFFQYIKSAKSYSKSVSIPKKELKKVIGKSGPIKIHYTPSKKKVASRKIQANFEGCDSSEQSVLNSAHDAAIDLASDTASAMNNAPVPTSAPRYAEWFGAANTNRHNTVKEHFNNIYDALDSEQVTFSCSCEDVSEDEYDQVYAYVYPDSPYTIHICGAFWNAEMTGTDSKAGTIVHETSHFNVVAGTDDYVYGQSDARDLADSDPDSAVDNADSHEYFAENTPYLSMEEPGEVTDDYGNTMSTAYEVQNPYDTILSGAIETGDDEDVFKVSLGGRGTLKVYTTGTLDTVANLMDRDGNVVTTDDDSGADLNFLIEQELDAETYYISVRSYDTDTGNYSLHFEFTPKINFVPVINYLLY